MISINSLAATPQKKPERIYKYKYIFTAVRDIHYLALGLGSFPKLMNFLSVSLSGLMIKPDLSYENGPEKLKAAAPAYTKVFEIALNNSKLCGLQFRKSCCSLMVTIIVWMFMVPITFPLKLIDCKTLSIHFYYNVVQCMFYQFLGSGSEYVDPPMRIQPI